MIKNLIILFILLFNKINIMLKLFMNQGRIECGIDEVGAGCLAGPVTISAVIWPNSFKDDKKHIKSDVFKDFVVPAFMKSFTNLKL